MTLDELKQKVQGWTAGLVVADKLAPAILTLIAEIEADRKTIAALRDEMARLRGSIPKSQTFT